MKKVIPPLFLLVFVYVLLATASEGEKFKSLRGEADITEQSTKPVGMDWKPDETLKKRSFNLQPPLIPHDITDYEVNTDENGCLECHGDEDSDAPKLSKTHYTDRDGKVHEEVSSLRYFCLQCHVGQVDAEPLVENTFQAK